MDRCLAGVPTARARRSDTGRTPFRRMLKPLLVCWCLSLCALTAQLPQSRHNIKVDGTNPLSELPNFLKLTPYLALFYRPRTRSMTPAESPAGAAGGRLPSSQSADRPWELASTAAGAFGSPAIFLALLGSAPLGEQSQPRVPSLSFRTTAPSSAPSVQWLVASKTRHWFSLSAVDGTIVIRSLGS